MSPTGEERNVSQTSYPHGIPSECILTVCLSSLSDSRTRATPAQLPVSLDTTPPSCHWDRLDWGDEVGGAMATKASSKAPGPSRDTCL